MSDPDLNSSKVKNPNWSRDELILALALYFKLPPSTVTEKHPEIVELSRLLNRLSIHTVRPDPSRFRNPNGVHMKMFNFKFLDPSQSGKGLRGGSRLDASVWAQFSGNRKLLESVAEAIRSSVEYGAELKNAEQSGDDELEEATEGAVLTRLHRFRERDRTLVRRKKESVLRLKGELACEVCMFNFGRKYGALGQDFIESHHIRPLSTLRPGQRTTLADLAIVCANCHRMLHQSGQSHTIETLRVLIGESSDAN